MCDRTRQSVVAVSWTTEPTAVLTHPEMERGWRFRQDALPHLNSVYTMASYLTSDTAEAEYAAQECFVRGLRRFDWYSGDGMKSGAILAPSKELPDGLCDLPSTGCKSFPAN
jgi:hypothetical protein